MLHQNNTPLAALLEPTPLTGLRDGLLNKCTYGTQLAPVGLTISPGARLGHSVTFIQKDPYSLRSPDIQHVAAFKELLEEVGTVFNFDEERRRGAEALKAFCNALSLVEIDTISDAAVGKGLPREEAVKLIIAALSETGALLTDGVTANAIKDRDDTTKQLRFATMSAIKRTQGPISTIARIVQENKVDLLHKWEFEGLH